MGLMALLSALFWLPFNQAVIRHLLAWSALASFCAVSPTVRQVLGRAGHLLPTLWASHSLLIVLSIVHFTMALSCLGDPGSLAFPEVTCKWVRSPRGNPHPPPTRELQHPRVRAP